MIFALLQPEEIDHYWPKCREILVPAFRNRVHVDGVDDYYPLLKLGQFQLWIALKDDLVVGSVVTCMEQGSRAKVLTILSLAGENLKDWIQLLHEKIEIFALANGCFAVEAVTRKGFSWYVPEFVEDGIVYVKILGDKK